MLILESILSIALGHDQNQCFLKLPLLWFSKKFRDKSKIIVFKIHYLCCQHSQTYIMVLTMS